METRLSPKTCFISSAKRLKAADGLERENRESSRDKVLGNYCNPYHGVSLPQAAGTPPGLTGVHIVSSASPKTVTESRSRAASMKADTQEAGADVKESGLFADAGHLEDGGLRSQSPSPSLSGGRSF